MGWRIVDWNKFEIQGDKRSINKFRGGLDYIQLPVKLDGDKLVELFSVREGVVPRGRDPKNLGHNEIEKVRKNAI